MKQEKKFIRKTRKTIYKTSPPEHHVPAVFPYHLPIGKNAVAHFVTY